MASHNETTEPVHPNKMICDRCGKVITVDGYQPETCYDCGGPFIHPTAEDLACDRCGGEDASRVFGPTDHNRLCEGCVEAVNVEQSIPDHFGDPAWSTDYGGIWILTVSGQCSCGNRDWGVAPDWKVPAEQGGGYMTSQCSSCLGTMEYSEQWERLDRLVSDYSHLHPEATA